MEDPNDGFRMQLESYQALSEQLMEKNRLLNDLLTLVAQDDVVYIGSHHCEEDGCEQSLWKPYIMCSDIFAYACADGEPFKLESVPVIAYLNDKYGWEGLIAYVAYKRKEEPLKALNITDKYFEAMKEITFEDSELWRRYDRQTRL